MTGSYELLVQNARIRYQFEVRRNITILQGDSATGKTALIEMIRDFYENGADSGVELRCERTCAVLEGRNWETILSTLDQSIIFIDEGNAFVRSEVFAKAIRQTDNYYVIVTRERLPMLSYGVDEIYGIRTSGKYGNLKQVFQEFYHLYGAKSFGEILCPDIVITEDSGSGYEFFKDICEKNNKKCISAEGKSNIISKLEMVDRKKGLVLVTADGAAFGSEISRLTEYLKRQEDVVLYLPESFEWLILKSGVIQSKWIKDILRKPENYIESKDYFSWEQFFTAFLVEITQNTYLKYSKSRLNPSYKQAKVEQGVLKVMEKIVFQKPKV